MTVDNLCYNKGVEGQVSAVFVSPAKSRSFTNRALDPRQVIGETVRLRFFAFAMPTSKLQREVSKFLSVHFAAYVIRENVRPDWLVTPDGSRLELDFYIEELALAVEVQGGQHFVYVPFFHGEPGNFNKRLEFDRFKQDVCATRGVRLVEIASATDIDDLLGYLPNHVAGGEWSELTDADIVAKQRRIAHNNAIKPQAVKEHKQLLKELQAAPDGLESYRQLKQEWRAARDRGNKKLAAQLQTKIQAIKGRGER